MRHATPALVPDNSMAQVGDFCPEESTMAVGSRRSWEAAYGDKTIDETTRVAPAEGRVNLLSTCMNTT